MTNPPYSGLGLMDYVGALVSAAAIVIEAQADSQLRDFRRTNTDPMRILDTGLWAWCRHPNYFGEILLWFGIYVYTLQALSGLGILIAFLSPLFIGTLIVFVSGIPLLEKGADARWGDNPDYQAYKKNTSRLIPLPPKD